MRPSEMLRKSRPAQLGAGALMLAIPASAVALTAGKADAQSAIQITLNPRHLAYGHDVTVTGTGAAGAAGRRLELEFAPAGDRTWRPVASTTAGRNGGFRFVTRLRTSGLVRVVDAGGAAAPRGTTAAGRPSTAAVSPSAARHLSVASRFRLRPRSIDVLGDQAINVAGKLLPAVAGRRVLLVGRTGRSWHTLASARTGPRGGFSLRYGTGGTGQQSLRVRFAGDRLNTPASAGAGQATVFRQSIASWYNDGGSTACGFHAYFGVANKDLPCGTQVTFHYGGQSVTAVVDDRGPFVGGREWDLNQNTAGALGFGGVDTVWSSL
jgi:rare lipoprotein A